MTVAADVSIVLRADIARLSQDLGAARRETREAFDSMSASAQALKGMLSGLAAGLSVGAFVSFIKNSIDATDALNDMSVRTKVAIEDLAGLGYAAKLGDTSLEGVAASISKLGQNIGKEGDKFRALGITATEPLEAFKQLADVFKDIQDPQQRAAFGAEALGKSWQEAAVLLDGGSAGIAALVDRGKELSGVTEETAAAAGKFNDGLDTLGFAAQGVGTRIAAGLLPMLNVLVDDFTATGKGADTAAGWVVVLSGAFKGLYTAGVIVATQLTNVGTAIGATAAAIVAAASGDFKGAATIIKSAGDDIAANWEGAAKRIKNAWSATSAAVAKEGDEVSKTAGATAKKVAGFLNAADIKAARDKAAADAEAAAKKERSAYAGVVASIKEKMAADQAEILGGVALTEAQKARIKLDEELASGKITLTKEHIAEAHALLEVAETLDKSAKALAAYNAMQKALADATEKAVEVARDEAAKNEELVKTFGMTKAAIEQMELARLQDQLAQRASTGLTLDEIDALEKLIEAKKRNAASVGTLEVLEAQKKAADDAAEAQVAFWKSIDNTAHDTFVSILNGSKDTATRLKETFKNIFFDWLYQMTIKKWIINIGTASSGGVGDIATALGGGASGGTSAAGLINAGKSIYDGFTSGFTTLSGSLGTGIVGLGSMFGSSALQAFGAGFGSGGLVSAGNAAGLYTAAGGTGSAGAVTAGAYAGAATSIFAGAGAGYLGGNLISGQYGSKGTVAAGTAIGAAIGSIVPVVGTALGALVGGLLGGVANRLFGMGEKKVQSTLIEGSLTAAGAAGNNVSNWTQKGGWFRSDKKGTDTSPLTSEQSAAFASTYKAILDVSKVLGDTIGADTTALSTRVQKLSIDFTGLATDADKLGAVTKFFEGVADSIATELVPNLASFQKEGESLSATMQRVVTDYANLDTVLASIGTTFGAVGASSIAGRENLIAAAGGIDKLASGVGYFQQNFLTDAERLAPVQKQLADAMKSLGLSSITTNDQFKTYLLGIDKTTAGGAALFAQLLDLAPAFNEITKATEAQAAAAAQAAADIAAALAATNKGYQDQIDQLLAAREGADAVRKLEIAGMDTSTVALYDRLAALRAEDAAMALAKEAIDAAAASAKAAAEALAVTNAGYDKQIAQLLAARQGAEAVRALEIAGMDASTVARYDYLAALKAEDAALAQAKAEADAAAAQAKAAADALASTNAGYMQQINQLLAARQGEAAVRALEIAGMDASTVALYDRLAALKAEDAALAASAAAQQAAAQQAAQLNADITAAWAANYQSQQQAMLQAQQKAQQEADQAAAQLASQRAAKELELYNLTHTAAEQAAHARELELAATAATLKPLQEQINAQKDLAAAAGIAADAIKAAADKAAAVASEGAGIARDVLTLKGDTAALRALELAALDPANRAAKQAYYALQDKMAADQQAAQMAEAFTQAQQQAAQEAARAQQEAADAAKALAEAWQDANKSILDQVAEIRGAIDVTGATSLAQAQAAFTTATAQARAGDLNAAKSLPELARALLDLGKNSAASAFDLRLLQAQVAASLAQTANQNGGAPAQNNQAYSAPAYLAPQPSNADTAAQMQAQVATLQQANSKLLESMDRALYVIAKNTGVSADIESKWDTIGLPAEQVPA